MRRFYLKFVLLLCLPVLPAYFLFGPVEEGIKRTGYRGFKEWDMLVSGRMEAKVIIQGSSRAWVHINPAAIEREFNTSAYNLGIDGYPFELQYVRYQLLVNRSERPDIIIQNVDQMTFFRRADLYQYEQFLPFLSDTLIRSFVASYNFFSQTDFYIPLNKYFIADTSKFLLMRGAYNFLTGSTTSDGKYKGYKASQLPWDNSFEEFKQKNPSGYYAQLEPAVITQFRAFLEDAGRRGIKVVLFRTPEYYEAQKMLRNANEVDTLIKGFCRDYKVPFLDFKQDSISYNKKLFYNSQHLNADGAELLNRKLIVALKELKVFE